MSVLVGLRTAPARRLSYGIVGGLSFIRTDSDGITWKKHVLLAPRENNRVSRHTYSSSWGATGGVDIDMPIGSVFALVVPLRFLYLVGEPYGLRTVSDENAFVVDTTEELRPGRLSVRAGIGLRVSVSRGRD